MWLLSELMENFYYILFWDCMKIFLLNLTWRSIFWNKWWMYGYLYLGLLYNFYAMLARGRLIVVHIVMAILGVVVLMVMLLPLYPSLYLTFPWLCINWVNISLIFSNTLFFLFHFLLVSLLLLSSWYPHRCP